MKQEFETELEKKISQRLQAINQVPARDPERAVRGRAAYISAVQELAAEYSVLPDESLEKLPWLSRWFKKGSAPQSRLAFRPVLALLLAVLLLLVSSASITVYAAQASLPNDFLYPIKTLSEDIRLEAAKTDQARMELALEFASRRVAEAAALKDDSESVPGEVIQQLQAYEHLALQTTANFSDRELVQALEQLQAHLREQERIMNELQLGEGNSADPEIQQIRAILQHQRRVIENGLVDPGQFQHQYQRPWTDTEDPTGGSGDTGDGSGSDAGETPLQTPAGSSPKITPGSDGSLPDPNSPTVAPDDSSDSGAGPGSGDGPKQATPKPGDSQNPSQPSKVSPGTNYSGSSSNAYLILKAQHTCAWKGSTP